MKNLNLFKLFIFLPLFSVISGNFLFAAELYKADAIVSYYGEKFHGKLTSNGETYNMYDLTCANKTLPFDTILKVTNLANNKSVQVRVNDRGPFVSGRELDLSKAAAEKIDMIKSGTTHVKIEIIKMGENTKQSQQTAQKSMEMMKKKEAVSSAPEKAKAEQAANKASSTTSGDLFEIQAGAFKDKYNANHFANILLKQGFTDVVLRKSGEVYKVIIKNIPAKERESVENRLLKNGYKDFVVKKL